MKNRNRGWQRVLLIILPYIFFVGIFQFIGILVLGVGVRNFETEKTLFQHVVVSFFGLLGTFGIIWLFVKYLDKEKLVQVGFQLKNRSKDIIVGIILGAIIMGVAFILLMELDEIQYDKIIVDFKKIGLAIILFIIVAFTEEVLMRGYILKNLMLSFNKYIALIVSSILFSSMHFLNPNVSILGLSVIFIAGILLGISYIHTKNLWFPIALHFSWNLFQTFFGFNVSGQDVYSIINFKMAEKNVVNGGDFGFEGSYLSIIVQVLVIIGIAYYYHKKNVILSLEK